MRREKDRRGCVCRFFGIFAHACVGRKRDTHLREMPRLPMCVREARSAPISGKNGRFVKLRYRRRFSWNVELRVDPPS